MFTLAASLVGLMILTAVHLRKDPASDIPMREMWKIKGYLTDGNLKYRR
ncbi:MAG: hypothetical protein AAFO98_09435 [Pseudomonadota bacterium]